MCTDGLDVPDLEGTLEWRPLHLRDNPDQSLYKVEDPDIKNFNKVDQETCDTPHDSQQIPN